MERCEEFLCTEMSSVRQYFTAQQYNLQRLKESVLTYLHRAPLSRLRTQSEWDELDPTFVKELLTERCERFETHVDALREIRMVLERKKPTTFPGQHLLCASCTAAREQQVGACYIFTFSFTLTFLDSLLFQFEYFFQSYCHFLFLALLQGDPFPYNRVFGENRSLFLQLMCPYCRQTSSVNFEKHMAHHGQFTLMLRGSLQE